jgi:hypothetical protein
MTDIDRSNSLTDLAHRIKAEHDAGLLAIKRGVEHCIACGQLLIEAKGQLKHGQFGPWLRDHCGIAERTARHYMRLARYTDTLKSKTASLADLTVEEAVALISPVAPAEHWWVRYVNELALIHEGIVATPVSLQLPDDLTFEQWKAVWRVIMTCCPMPEDFPLDEQKALLKFAMSDD